MNKKNTLEGILSASEFEAYNILLERGSGYLNQICQESKTKRSTLADALKKLQEKGLIEVENKNRPYYRPLSPENIDLLIKRERSRIDGLEKSLVENISELKAKYNLNLYRPKAKFYEGAEGIKEIHKSILSEKKEILAYVLVDEETDKPLESFWDWYYKKRLKEGISVRSISPDNEGGKKYKKNDANELRQTRLIPKEKFPLTIEKNICANKVAYMSLKKEEMIGIVIESKEIADSERLMFELAWDAAEKYNRDIIAK
jgi:HTH-type transcriptional regulator, sugar sensing transcriptional regulator